jgi:hypothetical protein
VVLADIDMALNQLTTVALKQLPKVPFLPSFRHSSLPSFISL